MNDKKLFTLPEKPVDQYRLEFYHMSVDISWFCINKITAIYHFDTTYEKATGKTGGVPVVNEWILIEDGRPLGRNPNWKSMETHSKSCFLTREEAVSDVVRQLNEMIAYSEANIAEMKELLISLKPEAMKK